MIRIKFVIMDLVGGHFHIFKIKYCIIQHFCVSDTYLIKHLYIEVYGGFSLGELLKTEQGASTRHCQ